jgi:RimJ/RimL family protein N-acetyltransferase
MKFKLETDNLVLRNYKAEDIEPYSTMYLHPKVQRFYSEEDCSSRKWSELRVSTLPDGLKSTLIDGCKRSGDFLLI